MAENAESNQPKKRGYISKLQEENEALKKQLGQQDTPEVAPVNQEDDRREMVEVTYGTGNLSPLNPNCAYKRVLPKEEALEALVQFYMNNRVKSIPREDSAAEPVNQATCYLKLIKRDITGKKFTFYKDCPLWIAAERIVNHPNYNIELVRKQDWEAYNEIIAEEERKNNLQINKGRIQKAIDTLAAVAIP